MTNHGSRNEYLFFPYDPQLLTPTFVSNPIMESVLNLVNLILIHEDCWTNYELIVIVNDWIIIMKYSFSHDLDFIFQWSVIKDNIEKAFRLSGKQNVSFHFFLTG